jgi:hypothetical protein
LPETHRWAHSPSEEHPDGFGAAGVPGVVGVVALGVGGRKLPLLAPVAGARAGASLQLPSLPQMRPVAQSTSFVQPVGSADVAQWKAPAERTSTTKEETRGDREEKCEGSIARRSPPGERRRSFSFPPAADPGRGPSTST